MISHLDGVCVRICEGCYRVAEGSDAILNGVGDYCDAECKARALARPKPKYTCPRCVATGERPCHHYRAVPAAS